MPATTATPDPLVPTAPTTARAMLCPFHDGAATLDLLLAELNPHDTRLFDAVLDLRSLCSARADASACVAQLFRVRTLLAGRHYLAFYRVRCWARRSLHIEVRSHRGAPWISRELPLDAARVDEIVNTALAALAHRDFIPATAHVRFAFATDASPAVEAKTR